MCALYSLLICPNLTATLYIDFLTSRQLQQTQAAKQTWATDTGHKSVVVSWMRKAATCENSDVGASFKAPTGREKCISVTGVNQWYELTGGNCKVYTDFCN